MLTDQLLAPPRRREKVEPVKQHVVERRPPNRGEKFFTDDGIVVADFDYTTVETVIVRELQPEPAARPNEYRVQVRPRI
jgi:hypothetical protein